MKSARLALGLLAIAACAPHRSDAYVDSLAAGDRASAAGRAREAAEAYDRAALATTRGLDHDEAVYRAGRSWERAGDRATALARFDWLAAHGTASGREPRGALAAAEIRFANGDVARAEQDLSDLVHAHPGAGPARRGIDLVLMERDAVDPSGASGLAWIDALLPRVQATEVVPALVWLRARRLEALGRTDEAITAYEQLLAMPYPLNQHRDDGGVTYAQLLLRIDRPRDALRVLDRVLADRETAVLIPGSYERPRYADAQLLRARTQRDALHDPAGAADSFHRFYTDFTHSRLRDDALDEEAPLRDRLGDHARACSLYLTLANEFPCTRHGRHGAEQARACGEVPSPSRTASADCAPRDAGG